MDNHLIWEVLLSNGTITHDQLSDALRWQRSHPDEDVGSILLARGIVTDGQLLAAYAQRLDVPFIEKDLVVKRPEVLKLVPETLARRYGIMPLDINNNKILVAISDPEDMSVIEDVKLSSRMDASIALASAENILSAIERYYRNAELFYREEQEEVQTVNFVSDDTAKKMDEIESSVNNTPVVKLVNNLVQQAYIRQASDIHIEPFENDVIVRMRIDGDLIEVMRLAPATLASVISRIKILSGMNIAEKRIPQDGRFNYTNDEFKVDLRVSTIPTMYGEKCVMRLLNTGGENLLSFEQLGMSRETIARFDHMLSAPNGIILVTGPTGSGKSTTLYAVLNKLRKPTINITTIEDPVEKQMFGINQVQVNTKAGMTFASGLRALLRQDPDVIMIGEIRDYETAEIAVRASITGHLVLSTLHTNDAPSSIVRLIDMGVPPYLVAASVNAIIGVLAAIIVPTTLHFVNEGRQEAANSELSEIRNAVNNGLTLTPTLTSDNILDILENSSIANTSEGNVVISVATNGTITFHSDSSDCTENDLTLNTGITITEGFTVTVPKSGEIAVGELTA